MKKILILSILLLINLLAKAQITFTKFYNFELEEPFNVLELDDGYLMTTSCGQTISTANLLIIKTDFLGDTLWVKRYGDSLIRYQITSLVKTYDNNFITGTNVTNYGLLIEYASLIKFDSNGDTLWTNNIYAPGSDFYFGIYFIECSDHGFLISGQQADSLGTDGNAVLIKTDSLGNFQWSKTFGGVKFDCAYSSVELPDKSFLTLGWTRSFSLGNRDLYLIKTDSLGILIWQKNYGTTFFDVGVGITKTMDGNYLLAGAKGNPANSGINGWLLKVDTSGAILWQKTLTTNLFDSEIWWARELNDGSIISAGSKTVTSTSLDSAWVVKTNSLGVKLWERGFQAGNNHSCFRDVIATSDGGYACVGFVYTGPSGNEDGWLVKLDSMGCDSTGCAQYTGVGIDDLNNDTEFSLYPNPVQDVLTIRFKFSLYSLCDVRVYNMLGEQVYAMRSFIQKQTTVPTTALPPGMYFVSLKYEGQTVTRKFVKAP